jgi:sugar phosphate isomerase/epimerase
LGELARRRGIRLGYHNHDFEFIDELNGAPFEALMAATDPDLVHLELDVYWVAKAGRDPLQLLRLYGDRVLQMHLKDLDWAGGIADLGTGTLDLRGLIQEGQDRRVTEYIIEHDNPVDPFATVSAGLAYISNWSRARGAVGSVR